VQPNKNNKLDLLWQFTRASFKMRYQNSLLGVLWVLIKPYAIFTVLYFLWSQREGAEVEQYGIYLLIGIVLYTFFQEMILYGNMTLVDKAHIILKANFSRQIAIISSLFSALINLGINLVLVFVIMVFSNVNITLTGIAMLTLVTTIIFMFGTGLAMFTSIINVRFRDLKNIFELGLFLFYWVSAVVFVPDKFSGTARVLMEYNPLGVLLNQARAGFGVYGRLDWNLMFIYLAVSLVLFALGWKYFAANIRKIAEYF
jgi:ABC-2 type transport system permease protein